MSPVKILHLEDNQADAEYIGSVLAAGGLQCRITRVESRPAFLAALTETAPDLVLSDFTLPSFDGLTALQLTRALSADLPFIFVSGSIGEEFAVECLKRGANDYLLKERLARLASAVERALEEGRMRKEKRRAEERVLYNALHDDLTGLANRASFLQTLQEALDAAAAGLGPPPALVIVGIDDFKTLCDGFGWEVGDALLQALAGHIRSRVPAAGMISRVGGDEFGLLFRGIPGPALAVVMADLQDSLRKPLACGGQNLYVTAGFGAVQDGAGYLSAQEMFRDCENALHHAKRAGKSGRLVFDPAMHRRALRFLETAQELRTALENREFRVHYQPIVELATGQVSGFEALVRWQHPRRGLIPPMDFIPVAERAHLISAIGDFVLREACRTTRLWNEAHPGRGTVTVSVNVSPQQFEQADLCEQVKEAVESAPLDPAALKLEITESGFLRNAESTVELLHRLRRLGVGLQIDDFGTGYSSLSYLHRFPVQALKIDRAFVAPIDGSGEKGSIARAVIDLAHHLGMGVVAEGIETPEQLDFLKQNGCECGQGYYFARPMDEEHAARYLEFA